tara:strand:+ start:8893 stop:10227 length:1335 start_codon:yes stop_codon:yes gene_type:complete
MNSQQLIQRYLLGEATKADVEELDRRLASDPKLRTQLIREANTDAGLREIALERRSDPVVTTGQSSWNAVRPWVLAAAAAIVGMMLSLLWSKESSPNIVATLVSGEDAAWESSLPTSPGSKLTAGYLKLTSGIATVRFESGAEVLLEAPSNLVLVSPMRGKLLSGAAVISVPEPAIGFVLETPDGYVVDHGTQFAVSVGEAGKSDFEVIEGEISVHLPLTGEEARLNDKQSASIWRDTLTTFDGLLPEHELEESPPVLRIVTNGRAGTVIRNNKRKKRIRPELLMVKQGHSEGWDLRSFFSFDVSNVDFETVDSVKLRLNLVPTGIGFATRLPRINRFGIYGLTNPEKHNWKIESLWEEAPSPDDGELIGTFEIPRSQQRGSVGIDNRKLLEFLQTDPSRPVTLIVARETGQINGEGPGLVHAFASDFHPEAAGPVLEFSLKSQ